MHVCPSCYERKGLDLEDIYVGACSACGWVRPTGFVGGCVYDNRNVCQYCVENGKPDQKLENDAAYTRENFQRRVRNYFPSVDNVNPGTDLLPFTMEKYQEWDRAVEYGIRDRCLAQAAFHRDVASVAGLIQLYEHDKYKFKEVAHALGRIDHPDGNTFLLEHVSKLSENPYYARLALDGLSETPGQTAFEAIIWLMTQGHFSVSPADGLELLLKLEFLAPGFLFQPGLDYDIMDALEYVGLRSLPQHLVYFHAAVPKVI
ncbi:MAG: hypothetical protein CVV42_20460 [Candidatus Riflebacteria bacterium HGW-Riflebacteria-2]|jgi:hypothetical protein|nr:MAG: hypothetical protein CVV42_20460 [Candidatus Riflebacteria bacterium HGW-Riflebacteria-2]